MPYATANGIQLYYEVHGAGSPLILLMGLGADGPSWKDHVHVYQDHFRCIVIDNRGAGRSDKPEGNIQDIKAITVGGFTNFALTEQGVALGWGANSSGLLGVFKPEVENPSNYQTNVPILITTNIDVSFSSNNRLKEFSIDAGTLLPAFSSDRDLYTLDILDTIEQIIVNLTTEDPNASVMLNSSPLPEGTTEMALSIKDPISHLFITVSSENSKLRRYEIKVHKILIQDAITAISTLPTTINLKDKQRIIEARANVEAVKAQGATEEQITNLKVLEAAEAAIASMKYAIQEVINIISGLPVTVTLKDETSVEETRTKVNAVMSMGAEESDITNLNVLLSAEAMISALEQALGEKVAAIQEAISTIESLPTTITKENKQAVIDARAKVNAAKSKGAEDRDIMNLNTLRIAEEIISEILASYPSEINAFFSLYLGNVGASLNELVIKSMDKDLVKETFWDMKIIVETDNGTMEVEGEEIWTYYDDMTYGIIAKLHFELFISGNTTVYLQGMSYFFELDDVLRQGEVTTLNSSLNDPIILLPGDYSNNGVIEKGDYDLWLDYYKQSKTTSFVKEADITKDGKVNNLDFSLWLSASKAVSN